MNFKTIIEVRDREIGRIFARNWNLKAIGEVKKIPGEEIPPDEYAARFFAAISRAVPDEAPLNEGAFDAGKPIDYTELRPLSTDRLDHLAGAYLDEAAQFMSPDAAQAPEPVASDSGAKGAPPNERQTERLHRLATSSIARSQRLHKLATIIDSDEKRRAARLQLFSSLGLSPALEDAFTRTALLSGGVGDALSKLREKVDILQSVSSRPLAEGAAETVARQMAETSAERLARQIYDGKLTSDLLGGEAPLSLPPLPELPPNPIYETNAELAEVSKLTRQLVDIEQRQAEHIHSLAETSQLALQESAAAGKIAADACRQTRNGVYIALATILFTVLGLLLSLTSSSSTDRRLDRLINSVDTLTKTISDAGASESSRREKELRALQEIERHLRDIRKPMNPRPSGKKVSSQ